MCFRTRILILITVTALGGEVWAQVDSIQVLRDAVTERPKDGDAWTRLGYMYLAVDSLEQAEEAMRMAAWRSKSARAYYGCGLVLVKKGVRHARSAFPFFRKALGVDPDFIEAQLEIARTHKLLGDPDAETAYRKVMEMDSTYAPAYIELAQWYSDNNYEMYHEEVRAVYETYLQLRPNDIDGYYGWALNYNDRHKYKAVLDMVLVVIEKKGIDARWAALMAQAYAARGEPDKAIALFERYLDLIDKSESVLYKDLRLVALPQELDVYHQLGGEKRERFFSEFWRKRDPYLVHEGNARLAEHYRRVWYSRTYFGKKAFPWDKRGEVYIRYGEPDYRSRSGFPNAVPSVAVEQVRTQLHSAIAGRRAFSQGLPNAGQSGFSGRGGLQELYGSVGNSSNEWAGAVFHSGLNLSRTGPLYPVLDDRLIIPIKDVPWESWIYTDIGGGVEFTFRDEYMNGKFEYPPMPDNVALHTYHTEQILDRLKVETPDRFTPPPGVSFLEFYYDVAQFRGDAGQTRVEVYIGVPPRQMTLQNQQGHVMHTLVMTHPNGEIIERSEETKHFVVEDTTMVKGTFAPDVVAYEMMPGSYKLGVKVTDKHSGKWGVYSQALDVKAFSDSLDMSDLEVAYDVTTTPDAQQFRKGNVWVIPMPSRHYLREQSPSVYYEVYNLTRNEFGQTQYRVDYMIQQDVRKAGNVFGALGEGFRRALTRGKPQVAVGYEREGQATWEPIYLELDTEQVKAGLNQLMVTVTDLVSGQAVTRQAIFQLSE